MLKAFFVATMLSAFAFGCNYKINERASDVGAVSNLQIGKESSVAVRHYFYSEGLNVRRVGPSVGVGGETTITAHALRPI